MASVQHDDALARPRGMDAGASSLTRSEGVRGKRSPMGDGAVGETEFLLGKLPGEGFTPY